MCGPLLFGLSFALGLVCALPAHAQHRNLTAGGELRHGVYGWIVPGATPPPVIFKQPVIVSQALGAAPSQPVYLYVPPGQVRKWPQHCGRWNACELPVFFVRMDNSPSQLGSWKHLREQYALHRE